MQRLDRLLVAAPRSGAGKTTVTLGLIAGAVGRGRKVQPFKAGPDFIDAGFHAALTRRPCYNLDGWMMPGERLAATFRRAMRRGADLAVVEGMMGLFDGAGAGERGRIPESIGCVPSTPVSTIATVCPAPLNPAAHA